MGAAGRPRGGPTSEFHEFGADFGTPFWWEHFGCPMGVQWGTIGNNKKKQEKQRNVKRNETKNTKQTQHNK